MSEIFFPFNKSNRKIIFPVFFLAIFLFLEIIYDLISEIGEGYLTLVLIVITAYYAIFTHNLVEETRRPKVMLDFKIEDSKIWASLMNYGSETARNIQVKFIKGGDLDFNFLKMKLNEHSIFETKSLIPNENISTFLGQTYSIPFEDNSHDIEYKITYERNDGKVYHDGSDINFRSLKDVQYITDAGTKDIVKSLKDVGKGIIDLSKIIKTYGPGPEKNTKGGEK